MIEKRMVYVYRCNKCRYEWVSKPSKALQTSDEYVPKVCAKCKNKKWNEVKNDSV